MNYFWRKIAYRVCIVCITIVLSFGLLMAQVDTLSAITDSTLLTAIPDTLQSTTISIDSTEDETVINHGVDLRLPKKALLYSAILPGMGQAYNKKYWKIPIVYSAFAGVGYATYFNQREYRRFKQLYIDEIDQIPHEFSGRINAANLRRIRDDYRKNMELSYIGLVAVYGLNLLDAFVDAHLKTFDVSDDLSLRVVPRAVERHSFGKLNTPVPGVAISLSLH